MLISLLQTITRTQTISQVEINSFVDDPNARTVVANVTIEVLGPRSLVLWSGDDYTSIGQWTDAQACDRIKELLNN